MVYYARMYAGKDPKTVRNAFISDSKGTDKIIIDESKGGEKESLQYQRAKDAALACRQLTIDCLDSIGKTNREISKELEWLSSNGIELRIINLPSTMTPAASPIDILKEVYAQLAEDERQRVRKAQIQGIRKAQVNQKKLGRTRIPYPDNWEENYSKWLRKEITIAQFMQETGLKRGTLYNLIKAAKKGRGT